MKKSSTGNQAGQPKYQSDVAELMNLIDASPMNKKAAKGKICTGLCEDSRKIKPGDLYIARPGLKSDGRRYIHQAVSRGAIAVLCEATAISQFVQAAKCPVDIYKIKKLANKLGLLGDIFYQKPSAELTIIGVTGTNGKTTCTQLIALVAEKLNKNVAVMGTLGNGQLAKLEETGNTTTDALTIQAQLAKFRDDKIDIVSMEVSSHALLQGRVNAINFNLALFTNLTRDHLDYHGDMKNYATSKKMLLAKDGLQAVIINADDAMGLSFIEDRDITADKYSFSITAINARQSHNSVWTESVVFHDKGIEAEIITPWGNVDFKSSMIGQFNLSNCLAVITSLGILGFTPKEVAAQLETISFVPGRMERFGGYDRPLVIVDYAHTPDALKNVLQAIKPHTSNKLWAVFGCGGDRDPGKRSEMAAIAEEYADRLVFTSDNPRSEKVEDIINEMLKGLNSSTAYEVEVDRKLAIRNSISKSLIGDVILVAGKGREQHQKIGAIEYPHNDVEIVEAALESGRWV